MSKQSGRTPFTFAHYSVVSENHSRNEDRTLVDRERGLAAVFDGVGGSIAGDIASRMAAYSIRQSWRQVFQQAHQGNTIATILEPCNGLDLRAKLLQLVEEAHERIRTKGWRQAIKGALQDTTDGPATTVAVVTFCRQPAENCYLMTYAHVGDSRIYLLRGEESLKPLTRDDGFLSLLLDDQIINEEDALRIEQASELDQLSDIEQEYFERRNGITQALGDPQVPTIHCDQVTILPGDRILLCSDGIHDNLTNSELEMLLRKGARTTVARDLVKQAASRSQQDALRAKADDMSAVVITCHG
ncbi:MAG TPA: PP2C family serine/threonine-protein phosphatase [Ktedonobacteraceae bacterium]|nr:PP2C family serine/threonine-protein phosphatase [Ktedonobacteraceae bacterium]